MNIDWLDSYDLERAAMKDRHGFWRSLFRETDEDIKTEASKAVNRILSDMGGCGDYATRIDWMQRWRHAQRPPTL